MAKGQVRTIKEAKKSKSDKPKGPSSSYRQGLAQVGLSTRSTLEKT